MTTFRQPPLPPPDAIPAYCPALRGVGLKVLRQYLNMYIYVWTHTGESFWMFPTDLTEQHLHGFMWKNCMWMQSKLRHTDIDCLY